MKFLARKYKGIFRKSNGDWWLDIYVGGRRKRKRIGPNFALAQNALRKIRVQMAENKFLDIEREPTILLKELVSLYMKIYSRPHKRSWREDDGITRRFMGFVGDIRAVAVTQETIEQYKAKRIGEVSGARVNREIVSLKGVFTKGIAWGKVKFNPVKNVKLFKENPGRTRYLTQDEWEALQRECSAWLLPIVQVAFHSGMRQGEILNLRWQNVDFISMQLHVVTSKSGYDRHIPINKSLGDVLMNLQPVAGNPYVFPGKNDGPLGRSGKVREDFIKAREHARLLDFRFHDLRHSFASHLVMAGVDLRTVGELLGHRSGFRMTLRYSHLSPAHKLSAVQKLDAQFGTPSMDTPMDTEHP